MKTNSRNLAIFGAVTVAALAAARPTSLKAGVSDEKPTVMKAVTVSAPKTHTLFMGADLSVSLGDELYPVHDVVGASWVLMIGGQEKLVSTKDSSTNMQVTPNLKLSEGSASIMQFNRMQSYSYANDPTVIITKRLTKSGMTTAMLEGVAQDAQNYADTVGNSALGAAQVAADSDKQFGDAANLNLARANFKSTLSANGRGYAGTNQSAAIAYSNQLADAALNNTKSEAESLGPATSRGLDAMNVDFVITSAKPLYNPYVVTMTRIHPKGAKPGIVQNHIYAEALNPVGDKPQHVHLKEDGFPFDYEVVDFQLHVYNRGIEVATSMSANRVDLTRDEAFQYVMMEYVGAHRGATLPPVPAMGHLPAALPTRLAAGDYTSAFYVRVSKDGLGEEAFSDQACTRRINDPFLDSVVSELRFKPALEHGKPASGIAEVNLGKLQI
ncbi:MAG TPA: hypothetical protein VFE25_04105 [Opitutaceae bacterium]|nr:hypothetical protein [Opitutaceae bacterium]